MRLESVIRCAKLSLTLLMIILTGCGRLEPAPPPLKSKAVFVFCDLTGSLAKSERTQAVVLTGNLLDTLPASAAYMILPINPITEKTEVLLRYVPDPSQAKLAGGLRNELKQMLKEEAEKNDKLINSKGSGNERTCILNGLRRASEFFSSLPPATYEYELVFISDMFEECEHVPENTGNPVTITEQNLQSQLSMVDTLVLPDLSQVRVSIIVPGTNASMEGNSNGGTTTLKPSRQTLNTFWGQGF